MGKTGCKECATGRFQAPTADGSSACKACQAGKYQDEESRSDCKDCAIGQFQGSLGQSTCIVCPEGFHGPSPGGNAACTPCHSGTFQNETGKADCKSCVGGQFQAASEGGMTACDACHVGTFQEDATKTGCKDCPSGWVAPQAESTACTNCVAGQHSDRVNNQCKDCPARFHSSSADGNGACTACHNGTFQNETGKTGCTKCATGRFQAPTADGSSVCKACQVGKYQNDESRSDCKDCAIGQFQGSSGQSTCMACPTSWTTSATVRSRCCTERYFQYSDAHKGQACYTECLEKNGTCLWCNSDGASGGRCCKQTSAGSNGCEDVVGSMPPFLRLGNTTQHTCVAPTCTDDSYLNDTKLGAELQVISASFPAGKESNYASNCIDGKLNTYCHSKVSSVEGDMWLKLELSAAMDVGDVKIWNRGPPYERFGEHVIEASYTGAEGSWYSCLPTWGPSSYTYPVSAGPVQEQCIANNVQYIRIRQLGSVSGHSRYLHLMEVKVFDTSGTPMPTTSPTISPTASPTSSAPTASPTSSAPTTSPTSTAPTASPTASPTRSCPQGTYGAHGGNCTRCAFGTFQDEIGNIPICKACAMGRWFNGTTRPCSRCPVHTFQDDPAAGLEAQRSLLFGALARAAKPQEEWPPLAVPLDGEAQASNALLAADIVNNVLSPYKACKSCPEGFEQENVGASRCDSSDGCPRSQGKLSGSCADCPAGTFSDNFLSGPCKQCVQGRAQNATGTSICKKCDAGQHQNTTGQAMCRDCRPGSYSTNAGSDACIDCVAGQVQPNVGAASCTRCEAGQHQNATGKIACLRCAPGAFSSGEGSVACTNCVAGTFASTFGKQLCDACQEGWFQNETSKSECMECPPSFFGPNYQGATDCVGCAPGTYQNRSGETGCQSCGAGTFLDDTACQHCPVGYVSQSEGATECTMCQGRRYQDSVGGDDCKECATDSTPTNTSSSCKCNDEFFQVGMRSAASAPNATAQQCDRVVIGSGGVIMTDKSALVTEHQVGCCLPCPAGGDCSDGFAFVRPGYWRNGTSFLSEELHKAGLPIISRCHSIAACPGDVEAAALGMASMNMSITGPCGFGYTGRLCGNCEDGWRKDPDQLKCHNCADVGHEDNRLLGVGLPLVVLFVVATVLLILALTWFAASKYKDADTLVADTCDADHGRKDAGDLVDTFEVLVPYLQRFGSIAGVYVAIDWPPFVKQLLGLLRLFYADLAFTFRLVSPCDLSLSHLQSLVLAMIMLPLLALCCAIALRLAVPLRKLRGQTESLAAAAGRGRTRLMAVLVMGGKLIIPGLGSRVARSFVCTSDVNGKSYLMVNLDTECWGDEHMWEQGGVLALFGAVFIVAGSIIALTIVVVTDRWQRFALERQRREDGKSALKLLLHRDATMQERAEGRAKQAFHRTHLAADERLLARQHTVVNFLVDKYKPHAFWWFVAELIFTLIFVALLMILQEIPSAQLAAALLTCLLHALMLSSIRPHVDPNDDQLALTAAVGYFICLVAGMVKLIHVEMNHGFPTPKTTLGMLNYLIGIVFLGSLFGVVWILLRALAESGRAGRLAKCMAGLQAGCRRVLDAVKGSSKRRVRVVPKRGSGSDDGGSTVVNGPPSNNRRSSSSSSSKDVVATQELTGPELREKLDTLPIRILRLSPGLFMQCEHSLQREYVHRVEALYEVQTRMVAVALQAITRGGLVRAQRVGEGGIGGGGGGNGKEEKSTNPHLERFRSTRRQRQQQRRRTSNTHRALRHTQAQVNSLVEKLRNGSAGSDVVEALRLGKWTFRELQGLHETHQLSDSDMVKVVRYQHEEEQKDHGLELEKERLQQASAAQAKRARRGLARAFTVQAVRAEGDGSGGAGGSSKVGLDVDELFRLADTDKDGIISGQELVALYRDRLGKELGLARAGEILAAGDASGNGDGGFDVEDLRRMLASGHGIPKG